MSYQDDANRGAQFYQTAQVVSQGSLPATVAVAGAAAQGVDPSLYTKVANVAKAIAAAAVAGAVIETATVASLGALGLTVAADETITVALAAAGGATVSIPVFGAFIGAVIVAFSVLAEQFGAHEVQNYNPLLAVPTQYVQAFIQQNPPPVEKHPGAVALLRTVAYYYPCAENSAVCYGGSAYQGQGVQQLMNAIAQLNDLYGQHPVPGIPFGGVGGAGPFGSSSDVQTVIDRMFTWFPIADYESVAGGTLDVGGWVPIVLQMLDAGASPLDILQYFTSLLWAYDAGVQRAHALGLDDPAFAIGRQHYAAIVGKARLPQVVAASPGRPILPRGIGPILNLPGAQAPKTPMSTGTKVAVGTAAVAGTALAGSAIYAYLKGQALGHVWSRIWESLKSTVRR